MIVTTLSQCEFIQTYFKNIHIAKLRNSTGFANFSIGIFILTSLPSMSKIGE